MIETEGRGCLFRAEKTGPRQPDYKGDCLINGVNYWVSGWLDTSNGKKRISLSFTQCSEKSDEELFE